MMQFYRLWEHGQRISVQYTIPYPAQENDLNLKNFTADPVPGMLFCTSLSNADTSIYKSTDYGKNWQRMTTLFNGLTPPIALLGGSVAGEIIITERPSVSHFSIGSTTDYFSTHVTNAQYTSYFTKPEVGINSGEIYGLNNAYASNRDFLLFSPDFGVTIDTVAIDSAIVYNANGNQAHKVCHGTLPGEIFLITLEPEQSGFPHVYKIYHSTDYGSTYLYKSELKFDESSSYTDFTGGREDCAFYVVNWEFSQQLQRQFMQVYYSADCGQTFTLYEHDLDAFVGIAEPEVKRDVAFVVFPNPSDNKLAFQSNTELKNSLFTLYDMQGKVILEKSVTGAVQQFDVSTLPAGTYPWQIVYKNMVIESGKWLKK